MFRKWTTLLASLLMLSFLVSCIGQEKIYSVLSDPFTLQASETTSKPFTLQGLKNSKSVRFYLALNTIDAATGQFSINDNTFVDFEVKADEKLPEAIDISFVLPRSWFERDNTIVFEHLSGAAIEVFSASLVFTEFQTSPYEE